MLAASWVISLSRDFNCIYISFFFWNRFHFPINLIQKLTFCWRSLFPSPFTLATKEIRFPGFPSSLFNVWKKKIEKKKWKFRQHEKWYFRTNFCPYNGYLMAYLTVRYMISFENVSFPVLLCFFFAVGVRKKGEYLCVKTISKQAILSV